MTSTLQLLSQLLLDHGNRWCGEDVGLEISLLTHTSVTLTMSLHFFVVANLVDVLAVLVVEAGMTKNLAALLVLLSLRRGQCVGHVVWY